MTNAYSALFKDREGKWFQQIKPFLCGGSADILKVGNGFGHLTEMIRDYSKSLNVLEVAVYPDTINKEKVTLYDGVTIPFSGKVFDITIFNLSLHHIPNNQEYLKNVLKRTSKRIILVEETYDTIFQKIHLVWRDWYFNIKASQPCDIHWNSYFKRSAIEKLAEKLGMKVVHRETNRHHSYYKELIVLDII